MPLPKLMLDLDESAYSFQDGDGVLQGPVLSGLPRTRLDVEDAPLTADVRMVMDAGLFQYWRAFYHTEIKQGALPFLLDLMVDQSELTECQVKIVRGTVQNSRSGSAYVVEFQIFVEQPEHNQDMDTSLIMLYRIYGNRAPYILSGLERLVNVEYPKVRG